MRTSVERTTVELMQAAYDQIAANYDDQWTVHLREPQARLTAALGIEAGMRCADLGCGTGVETLDMVRLAAPGEVVGVDCSSGMLEAARRRAQAEGLGLTTECREAEEFIRASAGASFDVVTLRFCLAYLDWEATLPVLPRLLRPAGRVGVLANLASSGRQAYAIYRVMVEELGLPEYPITAPESIAQISAALEGGGASIEQAWVHSFRLWFASGADLASWLQVSGFATHPAIEERPRQLVNALWERFAERVEEQREPQGLPLDFDVAGVVAAVPARS